ncbi:hypothetical protein [Alkalihalobacillus sp. 1P02AB]|uniref:hypothetical protein n=1 Tax=Alkalihalobacillus sp. 1P02AB TaxID=3132260 RepID=UPI0039A5576F
METVKEWIEILYYLSGILLVIGLYFAYRQIIVANKSIELATKNIDLVREQIASTNEQVKSASEQLDLMKKDSNDRHKRASVEKSLEYLSLYANNILVEEEQFVLNLRNMEIDKEDDKSLFTRDFKIDPNSLEEDMLRIVIEKQNLGLIHIFNRLEYFSIAILCGLADEEIVFIPISKSYCNFIEWNYQYLSILRYEGTPYKNLVELYNVWSNRLEVERLTLQVKETEDMIKQRDGIHKRSPIGVSEG